MGSSKRGGDHSSNYLFAIQSITHTVTHSRIPKRTQGGGGGSCVINDIINGLNYNTWKWKAIRNKWFIIINQNETLESSEKELVCVCVCLRNDGSHDAIITSNYITERCGGPLSLCCACTVWDPILGRSTCGLSLFFFFFCWSHSKYSCQ